jgi:sporulation protein YlmC with PRC-barrel domain
MRTKSIRGVEVVDITGATIGILEDIDIKKDGRYALIVRGEVNIADAREFKKRFGVSGVGKDFFEVSQDHVGGVGDKIVLNKGFEDISDVVVLSE